MQVKAREETLARDAERHQQLKEESKKQVSCLNYSAAKQRRLCISSSDCSLAYQLVTSSAHAT